jgi:hypothetical protein
MPNCQVCKTINPPNARFCFRCGSPFTQRVVAPRIVVSSGLSPLQKGILAVAGVFLVIVVGIAELIKKPKQLETSSAVRSSDVSKPADSSRVDNEEAIASFRKKIMSLPESNRMVLAIEGTPVHGVVRIQVSNLWFNFQQHEKRQLTQMFANAWSAELRGQPAILHIYDVTGREIAGTKAFGGVWVEDE